MGKQLQTKAKSTKQIKTALAHEPQAPPWCDSGNSDMYLNKEGHPVPTHGQGTFIASIDSQWDVVLVFITRTSLRQVAFDFGLNCV